jgi:ACT domain-containing protein
MTNTEKKWYLLLVENMTKDETQITIKKTQLVSSDTVRTVLDVVDNLGV